jgi:cytosine/adenosine deaminase-related metal-dependent hydrolase
MIVEGADLDLSGLQILPGLINAHDHLQFALFPRLGKGPYANATDWAHDIYHPEQEPVRSQLAVPKEARLIWGGLRNLIAGVTTVSHHDEYHPVFDSPDFPVRVIKNYGWAHSLEFTHNVRECFERTPAGTPFLIHLAEGTDEIAAQEIFRLHEVGALNDHTVLIHAVGIPPEGWDLVRRMGAAVIWCPRSNLFTLGRTLDEEIREAGVPMALGTDSPLTAEGDLLDEIQSAQFYDGVAAEQILRLPSRPNDWIAAARQGCPAELVVIEETIRLISPRLAPALLAPMRELFHPLCMQGRPPVLVRCNIPELVQRTKRHLGTIRLGGRTVSD